jgi:enamine deaminase RidA (YjgF/YER057c/UK114 family)
MLGQAGERGSRRDKEAGMKRQDIYDGTEASKAYARAVRFGNQVHVSGTTAMAPGGTMVGGDLYGQCKETYRKIASVLDKAGAGMADVVRIVAYVTDIGDPDGFNRATIEVFEPTGVRPAATLVEISRLYTPEMLVEIEAYALVAAD